MKKLYRPPIIHRKRQVIHMRLLSALARLVALGEAMPVCNNTANEWSTGRTRAIEAPIPD